jgi:hypothetical protein
VEGLERVRELSSHESGLAVVIAQRQDGSAYASVVNAGVVVHPVIGESVVAFVARVGTKKLSNLRLHAKVTVVFRAGWEWIAVEGDAELAGPDDHLQDFAMKELPALLRAIYAATVGGSPDDWQELDGVVAHEGHTAVLVRPVRCYSSPA